MTCCDRCESEGGCCSERPQHRPLISKYVEQWLVYQAYGVILPIDEEVTESKRRESDDDE